MGRKWQRSERMRRWRSGADEAEVGGEEAGVGEGAEVGVGEAEVGVEEAEVGEGEKMVE